MVKVSDVLDLLKYHYNTDDIRIVQVTDRNGDDIQIWNMWKDVVAKEKEPTYILDYKIPIDCLLTMIVDGNYHDEELDDILLANMTLLIREIRLKNILEYEK
jgi:hypothetical protein